MYSQEEILAELDAVKSQIASVNKTAQENQKHAARAIRQSRIRSMIGTLALVAGLTMTAAPKAAAQFGTTLSSLAAAISKLQSDLAAETQARKTNTVSIQDLGSRATALETKTQFLSVSGTDTIFHGTNVYVQNGSGNTDGPVNGLGNLIIGYNEDFGGSSHTGSHNLVLGVDNSFTSYSGFISGAQSIVSAPFACVLAGLSNTASGQGSCIAGGGGSTASGIYSTVCGGLFNQATAYLSTSGGYSNVESRQGGWSVSSNLHN